MSRIKFGIWSSIPEPVPDWGACGCGCGKLQCMMTSPYIDTLTKTMTIQLPGSVKSLYGGGVLLAGLAYLGWGRGGLHGAGSGGVGVGEELVPEGQP